VRGRATGLLYWLVTSAVIAAGLASKAAIAFRQSLTSDDAQPAVVFYDIIANHNYLLKNWYIVTNSHLLTEFPVHFLLGVSLGMSPFTIKLGVFLVFTASVLMLAALLQRVCGPRPSRRPPSYRPPWPLPSGSCNPTPT
jgi:hypothetical protein